MSTQQTSSDVVIVGGGLVGLSAAFQCASAGAKVTCLDQHQFGVHQSMQNWGFARQQGRGPVELPMMKIANRMWRRLSDDLGADVGWVEGGNLAVYDTAQEEESYRAWLEHGRAQGVDSTFVTLDDVRQLIPAWRRPIRGGLYAASDGHADPQKVVRAYIAACEHAGVQLVARASVTNLVRRGDRLIGARTADQLFTADHVVVAAGAWSRKLLATAGIEFPQNYVVGTVSLTSALPPVTAATVWGPGFSFRQRADGRFVCALGGGGRVSVGVDTVAQVPKFFGAFRKNRKRFSLRPGRQIPAELKAMVRGGKAREVGPPNARVDRAQPGRALQRLQQTIAGLEAAVVEESWAGVIDSTPDALPVIDGDVGVGGLILATGFSGHGYGLTPAVGHVVASIVEEKPPICDLSLMRFSRFTSGDFAAPDAIL
ncbi:FAD-binding oxidoreductase [Mycobacterium sp. 21AC1]|uniref:NAD(P)/FAD-dependent oxidoreductase n=1 Tax=[Mycobacterium] appelbergii TaxID=2939269 RepID=UPI0029391889|nr:FAD-binding oxidoreductase [Mycobacterium sp. 21AC1]MDV3123922.1 FAD-binding oxidoreductase [Mycobacterium sp. 21AC1]